MPPMSIHVSLAASCLLAHRASKLSLCLGQQSLSGSVRVVQWPNPAQSAGITQLLASQFGGGLATM